MDPVTIAILITLVILCLCFIFYKKIVGAAALIVKILFPVSIILILSTLFLPLVYSNIVESQFSQTQLAQNLKDIDKALTDLSKLQAQVSNSVLNVFNPAAQLTTPYTSNIYQQVQDTFTNLLRVSILVIGLVLLLVLIYIRYAFSGIFEVKGLENRIKTLEKQVEELKKNN